MIYPHPFLLSPGSRSVTTQAILTRLLVPVRLRFLLRQHACPTSPLSLPLWLYIPTLCVCSLRLLPLECLLHSTQPCFKGIFQITIGMMFRDRLNRRFLDVSVLTDKQSVVRIVSALLDILWTFSLNWLQLLYIIGWNGTDNYRLQCKHSPPLWLSEPF